GLALLRQVTLSGDLSCRRLHAAPGAPPALDDKPLPPYPAEHEAALYQAAQLPPGSPRPERLARRALRDAHHEESTTRATPPLGELRDDPAGHPAPTSAVSCQGHHTTAG